MVSAGDARRESNASARALWLVPSVAMFLARGRACSSDACWSCMLRRPGGSIVGGGMGSFCVVSPHHQRPPGVVLPRAARRTARHRATPTPPPHCATLPTAAPPAATPLSRAPATAAGASGSAAGAFHQSASLHYAGLHRDSMCSSSRAGGLPTVCDTVCSTGSEENEPLRASLAQLSAENQRLQKENGGRPRPLDRRTQTRRRACHSLRSARGTACVQGRCASA